MEIDFLIAKPSITSKHNISPIEVKSTQSLYHFIFGKVCQKVQELPIDSLRHSHLRLSGKRWDSISATLYDTPAINKN